MCISIFTNKGKEKKQHMTQCSTQELVNNILKPVQSQKDAVDTLRVIMSYIGEYHLVDEFDEQGYIKKPCLTGVIAIATMKYCTNIGLLVTHEFSSLTSNDDRDDSIALKYIAEGDYTPKDPTMHGVLLLLGWCAYKAARSNQYLNTIVHDLLHDTHAHRFFTKTYGERLILGDV